MINHGKRLKRLTSHFWLAFAIIVMAPSLLAGVLTGELDKSEGSLDDEFIYTLTIEGSYDQLPDFPSVEHLQVAQAETRQSVQIINGQMTRQFQINYIITADQEGDYTIPPIVMELDGKTQQTLPLTFTVKGAATANPRYGGTEAFFLDRHLSKKEIYVGEGIIVTDQVIARERLIEADLKRDDFPDSFRQIDIDEEKRYQRIFSGREYDVVEFKKVLIPTKEGTYRLPPAVLEAMVRSPTPQRQRPRSRSFFDDFFGRTPVVRKRARSDAFEVVVKALPLQGRSSGFSGLVGNFRIEANLSTRNLNAGETATLTISVRGSGLTDGMAEPQLTFPDELKVYSDKPISSDRVGLDGVNGERVFKYALVPTAGGQIDLGRLDVQVFNPESGQYEVINTDLGMLTVTGGEPARRDAPATAGEGQGMAASKSDVKALRDDIVGLMPVDQVSDGAALKKSDWLVVGSLSSFGLAFMFLGFLRRRQLETSDQRAALTRQRQAFRRFKKELGHLPGSDQEAVFQLGKLFRQFVSDQFALDDLATGQQALLQVLQDRGFTELVETCKSSLDELDRLYYSGCAIQQTDVERLKNKLEAIAQELSK